MDVFIARQPIFDKRNNLYGYELLYRHDDMNAFDQSISANVATSILLMNSYYTFGIENLVGSNLAFINFDQHLVESEIPLLLDKNKVIIEILENVVPTPLFLQKIHELKKFGYIIAIDDYVKDYQFNEITQLSNIIKIDFMTNSRDEILSILKEWKHKGKMFLAEKVETQEEFEWAYSVGFDLFQGYYFSKPSMVKGKGMNDSSYQYIRIMNELNAKEVNYKEIASIIERDVNLTYKLLKMVNSNFTSNHRISSIQHGLAILGINAFEKWFTLAMVQNLKDEKPDEIVKVSMTRSRFLEAIATQAGLYNHVHEMTLVGLLSVIDGLLERPMEDVIMELPLEQDIRNALLHKEGKYTKIYETALLFERGKFNDVIQNCREMQINPSEMPKLYFDAIIWAEKFYNYMEDATDEQYVKE